MRTLKPQMYIACLSSYANGMLHGAWIDANQSIDELNDEIAKILKDSPMSDAEEWAIHDYSDFGAISLSESESMETISTIAEFISEHGRLGAGVLEFYSGDLDYVMRLIDEGYHGEYDSEEDFAFHLAEETMEIPECLRFYIDYEKLAYDLFINDYFSVGIDGKTHVFSRHI